LDLDAKTYEVHSTVSGIFDGMPDQVKRLVHDDENGVQKSLLYFCEEGGVENGVHARDENGWFFTILESDTFNDETTGLAFSPDGKHLYVSFQHKGMIFDIWREDGLPFYGKTLNVKYHDISGT
jgi:secreted PhoX family phosphatase